MACTYGPSEIASFDLGMLCKANKAVAVVGEKHGRNKGMEDVLRDAIKSKSLVGVSQVLLPNSATPRLGTLNVLSGKWGIGFDDYKTVSTEAEERANVDLLPAPGI